jgi:type IV pilus assembly protein PilM
MAKIILGLDIGTSFIKAAQISAENGVNQLLAAGFIASPSNVLTSTNPHDEQVLATAINRLAHDMKISTIDVSASLPSSKVITRVVEMPLMSEQELSSSIKWEAEQYIPLPLSRVKIDYEIISVNQETNKMKVLLVAAPISIIEKYMRIISLAGLTPVALETEILSVARSISVSSPQLTNVLVLAIGATTSEVAVLHNQILIFTKSFPIGGNTFTRSIAQELGFELPQAEEYKKSYGLDESKLEGKIAKTILPLFSNIFAEMEKTVVYFKEQYPKEELKNVIICGGGAKLPGLIMAVTKHLGLDAQIINPFENLAIDSKILPALMPEAPMYTVAVGLGLKDI